MKNLYYLLLASLCMAQTGPPPAQQLFRTTAPNSVGVTDIQVTLAGALPISPDSQHPARLYIDNELMNVISVQTTGTYGNVQPNSVLGVQRAFAGTVGMQHNPGSTAYFGYAYQFITSSPAGACPPNSPQYVNYASQLWFNCTGGTWVGAPTPNGGGGGSAAFSALTPGTNNNSGAFLFTNGKMAANDSRSAAIQTAPTGTIVATALSTTAQASDALIYPNGSDITAAWNTWVASLPNGIGVHLPCPAGGYYLASGQLNFPGGHSYFGDSGTNGLNCRIYSTYSGQAAFNFVGSDTGSLQNLFLYSSNSSFPPQVIAAFGRTVSNPGSHWSISDTTIGGYATTAVLYSIGSEEFYTDNNTAIILSGGGALYTYYTSTSDDLSACGTLSCQSGVSNSSIRWIHSRFQDQSPIASGHINAVVEGTSMDVSFSQGYVACNNNGNGTATGNAFKVVGGSNAVSITEMRVEYPVTFLQLTGVSVYNLTMYGNTMAVGGAAGAAYLIDGSALSGVLNNANIMHNNATAGITVNLTGVGIQASDIDQQTLPGTTGTIDALSTVCFSGGCTLPGGSGTVLAGDVTGTAGANSVVKVNGASVPINQSCIGTNNLGQLVTGTLGGCAGGGGGTVTSVGLSLPSIFAVSGSPVTTSGSITATFATQTAGKIFAAPANSTGGPTFRALVATDIPIVNQNTTGNAATATALATPPSLSAGSNMTITGSWPTLVFSSSGGGGSVPGTQYATTGTTGIANAIAACGVSISCSVIAVPNYGNTEALPGLSTDINAPASVLTSPNIGIIDNRSGNADILVWNGTLGYNQSLLWSPMIRQQNVFTNPTVLGIYAAMHVIQNSWDAGSNQCDLSLGYCNKSTYSAAAIDQSSYTPGQLVSHAGSVKKTSVGDMALYAHYGLCWGGYYSKLDEGCEWGNRQIYQGNVEYVGTASTNYNKPATLTLNVTQGGNTQGAGRFLARTSSGIVTGNASSYNCAPGPCTVTLTASSLTASTATATLGSDITAPGAVTITPTFLTGSISTLTTSTMVVIGDENSYEQGYPTGINVGAGTFTFQAGKIHKAASSSVSWGGSAIGGLFEFNADRVTSAQNPQAIYQVIGTLHVGWPILSNTANTVTFWAGGPGYSTPASQFNPSGAAGYTIYQMAEVASVYSASSGGISNTLTLAPNNLVGNSGDTFSEFLYPRNYLSSGNDVIESRFPDQGGVGVILRGPKYGNSADYQSWRDDPDSHYTYAGGMLPPPLGIHLFGVRRNYGLLLDRAAVGSLIASGCVETGCMSSYNIAAASYTGGTDYMEYDPINKCFRFSANGTFGSCVGSGGTSPLTTKGDLYAFSNINTRLAVGVNGQHLVADSTQASGLNWITPTTLANGLGTAVTGSGTVKVNIAMLPRKVTGTTDTILATDCGGLITYNNASAVAVGLPQAGLGGNFLPGCPLAMTNYGAGAVTVTASVSLIGPTVNAQIIPAATGSGSSIVTHSLLIVPDGTDYQIASKN